jgi:hypothetical protein
MGAAVGASDGKLAAEEDAIFAVRANLLPFFVASLAGQNKMHAGLDTLQSAV